MPNTGGLVWNSRKHAFDVDNNGEANADRKCRDMPLRLGIYRGRVVPSVERRKAASACMPSAIAGTPPHHSTTEANSGS